MQRHLFRRFHYRHRKLKKFTYHPDGFELKNNRGDKFSGLCQSRRIYGERKEDV